MSTRDIEASASTASGEQDLRARMADAFIALGSGVDAASAQAQANAFYRSSRQDWARALDSIPALGFRSEIATAFRTLGTGVFETTSQERTVAFYRGSGQGWAANLG